MSTYRRSSHWRRGKYGKPHRVRAHDVTRGSRSGRDLYAAARTTNSRAQRKDWWNDPDKPNSHCPMCGEPVWFFRNKNGGCAYFDALGKPWPLHPCMELQQRTADRMAAAEAARLYAQSSPVAGLSPTFAQTRRAVVDGPTSAARSTYLPTAMAAMRMHPRSSTERAPQTTIADYVLSWWTVMSRLIAVCAVLVVAMVLLMQAGFLSTLLLAWLIIVPCAIQGLAYAAFLLLVPPPRGSTEVTIKVCLMVPLFAAQTALSSVVTLGIGPVAHAVRVLKEIPWAQAAASSSTYSTRAVPRQ